MNISDLFWKWLELRKFLLKTCAWRNRLNHDRIILDVTFACNLKCDNCNRSCGLAPAEDRLSLDQVRRFIQESIDFGRQWTHIMLEGGEPTLHPQLMEIIELLTSFRTSHSPTTQIILCTNGFGPEVGDILRQIPPNVQVYNSRKHGKVQTSFDAFHRAPMDETAYKESDFTRACFIPTMWGLSLNRYGYYPCSPSSGIDRVVGKDLGRKVLPRHGDPMHRELDAFCRWCGHYIRFNRETGPLKISESWQWALGSYHEQKPMLGLY